MSMFVCFINCGFIICAFIILTGQKNTQENKKVSPQKRSAEGFQHCHQNNINSKMSVLCF